ncbi:MAG: helix-turn-helix domain-containing protein [Chloroflexota bacterium]
MDHSIPLNNAGQRPERSDAVANRERILIETRQLFAEHGPTAVNMSDVVRAAGIGRGTLYRHFPNKGELCLAVMNEEIAEFQNEVLGRLRHLSRENAPAMSQLDEFLSLLVIFTDTYTALLREVQAQGLSYFDKKQGTPTQWQQATVLGLLQMAAAAGEIGQAHDIEYLADAVLAPLNPQLFYYQREVQGFSAERISNGLRAFVRQLE